MRALINPSPTGMLALTCCPAWPAENPLQFHMILADGTSFLAQLQFTLVFFRILLTFANLAIIGTALCFLALASGVFAILRLAPPVKWLLRRAMDT